MLQAQIDRILATHETELEGTVDTLHSILNCIDVGTILVDYQLHVLYKNASAIGMAEALFEHTCRSPSDTARLVDDDGRAPLWRAIRFACSGSRAQAVITVTLAGHSDTLPIAVMSMPRAYADRTPGVHAMGDAWPCQALLLLGCALPQEQHRLNLLGETHRLTGAEKKILQFMLTGIPVKGIARINSVAESTVRTHVKSIYAKLGCNSVRGLNFQIERYPLVSAGLPASRRRQRDAVALAAA